MLDKYSTRKRMIAYVAPHIFLFPTEFALVFGTRHGVAEFIDEILLLYGQGYFKNLIISGGTTRQGTEPETRLISRALIARGIPESEHSYGGLRHKHGAKCRLLTGESKTSWDNGIVSDRKDMFKTPVHHDSSEAMARGAKNLLPRRQLLFVYRGRVVERPTL